MMQKPDTQEINLEAITLALDSINKNHSFVFIYARLVDLWDKLGVKSTSVSLTMKHLDWLEYKGLAIKNGTFKLKLTEDGKRYLRELNHYSDRETTKLEF